MNQILPAAFAYQKSLADSITALKSAGVEPPAAQLDLLKTVANKTAALKSALDSLEADLAKSNGTDAHHQGETFRNLTIPAMLAVRKIADELEGMVEDDLWPLPKYREMLFQY